MIPAVGSMPNAAPVLFQWMTRAYAATHSTGDQTSPTSSCVRTRYLDHWSSASTRPEIDARKTYARTRWPRSSARSEIMSAILPDRIGGKSQPETKRLALEGELMRHIRLGNRPHLETIGQDLADDEGSMLRQRLRQLGGGLVDDGDPLRQLKTEVAAKFLNAAHDFARQAFANEVGRQFGPQRGQIRAIARGGEAGPRLETHFDFVGQENVRLSPDLHRQRLPVRQPLRGRGRRQTEHRLADLGEPGPVLLPQLARQGV